MNDQLQIISLSAHVAAGVNQAIKKRGGLYLILVLDVEKPTWDGPKHAVLQTLTSVN